MSAPERIWANEGLEWHSFDCSDVKAGWTHPYILATPEALAASPEVAKLVADAEARGMEQIASELHQMAMMVPDYESSKILENRASALRTIAAPTRAAEETGT